MKRSGAAFAVALLLLAACGEDGEEDQAETLDEYFTALASDPAESHILVEEAVADCMAEQGFEYTPTDPPDFDGMAVAGDDLSPEEFREQHGYGITMMADEASMSEGLEVVEPSEEMLEGMDEAERQAYQDALHGVWPTFDPNEDSAEDMTQPMEPEEPGCRQKAQDEVYGGMHEVMQELQPEFEQLQRRYESDQRIVEGEQGWVACMSDAGWDFSDRHEPWQYLQDKMNDLRSTGSPGHVEVGGFEEFDADDPRPSPDPIDEAELEELRAEELAIAAADLECEQEHLPRDLQEEVRAEYEGQFIEENRDTLEQIGG